MTETPEVAEALARLRARVGEVRLGELIVLGAQEKLRRLRQDNPEADAARRRLSNLVLTGATDGDPELADNVRRDGWTRG